jgi:hypothetical protein
VLINIIRIKQIYFLINNQYIICIIEHILLIYQHDVEHSTIFVKLFTSKIFNVKILNILL